MNSLTRLFGGETDSIKKFTGKIRKSTICLNEKGGFVIRVQEGKYEDIIKKKYGIKL